MGGQLPHSQTSHLSPALWWSVESCCISVACHFKNTLPCLVLQPVLCARLRDWSLLVSLSSTNGLAIFPGSRDCSPRPSWLALPSCQQLARLPSFSTLVPWVESTRQLYYFKTGQITQWLGEEFPALILSTRSLRPPRPLLNMEATDSRSPKTYVSAASYLPGLNSPFFVSLLFLLGPGSPVFSPSPKNWLLPPLLTQSIRESIPLPTHLEECHVISWMDLPGAVWCVPCEGCRLRSVTMMSTVHSHGSEWNLLSYQAGLGLVTVVHLTRPFPWVLFIFRQGLST